MQQLYIKRTLLKRPQPADSEHSTIEKLLVELYSSSLSPNDKPIDLDDFESPYFEAAFASPVPPSSRASSASSSKASKAWLNFIFPT